ncbi:hypothetical protein E3T26_09710 [Cryobacterium sp. TMT1-21]|uniref:Uncharacterized protein n=1 Tax=Cryobacterium shii TaxID=1259235 RepID=A0AAQ2HFP6_9MICO|nr:MULTISPECIES: hypothetical protein [Cryobacterium]TFC46178.1 hypothetical protein E3O49_10040 [Cryobacterium shii]TFC81638.1 hypothetical protein E3T24_14955 [Cryobacterium sp. TmT2-59]TFD13294.1 hypothetical protein E3T26_09710 [Cryobacterium sp. TMT1-21]TFD16703.1 hypothetical protein E3T32_14895 [Cryobacterium sp. TMT2-23]TFD37667.1 hypothetical protein E3T37_11310 [Cryobacterium sp. TMT2-10]
MFKYDNSSRPGGDVNVTALTPTAWQVQDRRRTGGDGPVLLGFIQQFSDVFEVMNVTRPLERTYVSSLAGAVASITGGTVTQ